VTLFFSISEKGVLHVTLPSFHNTSICSIPFLELEAHKSIYSSKLAMKRVYLLKYELGDDWKVMDVWKSGKWDEQQNHSLSLCLTRLASNHTLQRA
jgi:hypothetical protein